MCVCAHLCECLLHSHNVGAKRGIYRQFWTAPVGAGSQTQVSPTRPYLHPLPHDALTNELGGVATKFYLICITWKVLGQLNKNLFTIIKEINKSLQFPGLHPFVGEGKSGSPGGGRAPTLNQAFVWYLFPVSPTWPLRCGSLQGKLQVPGISLEMTFFLWSRGSLWRSGDLTNPWWFCRWQTYIVD